MKALIIFALVFFSLKMFANEVGEKKSTDCKYSSQSTSRDAKSVASSQAATSPAPVKTLSK